MECFLCHTRPAVSHGPYCEVDGLCEECTRPPEPAAFERVRTAADDAATLLVFAATVGVIALLVFLGAAFGSLAP